MLELMEQLEQADASLKERADEIASLNSGLEVKLKAFDDEMERLMTVSRRSQGT